jgi:hypothetical protein
MKLIINHFTTIAINKKILPHNRQVYERSSTGSNISKVCRKHRKHAKGITFFYEEDNTWINIINNNSIT